VTLLTGSTDTCYSDDPPVECSDPSWTPANISASMSAVTNLYNSSLVSHYCSPISLTLTCSSIVRNVSFSCGNRDFFLLIWRRAISQITSSSNLKTSKETAPQQCLTQHLQQLFGLLLEQLQRPLLHLRQHRAQR
jgi:hypothetical protein